MPELTKHKCPKCAAQLAIERADHHLTGHEWLRCPVHGNIRRLHESTIHEFDGGGDALEDDR